VTIALAFLLTIAAGDELEERVAAELEAEVAPLPIDLSWAAPPECPKKSDVTDELDRIARARPGTTEARLVAEVTIKRVKDELRLELLTERDGRRGSRTLRGHDCAALMRGATLILALAFGPGVELIALQSPGPPPLSPVRIRTSSASKVRATKAPPVIFEDEAAEISHRGLGVAIEGRSAIGWLPSLAFGFAAGAQYEWTAWAIALRAGLWLPEREPVPSTRGGGAEARFFAATIGGLLCHRPLDAVVRLAACIGAEAGLVRGAAVGTDRDSTQLAPWYGGLARLEVELMIESPVRPYLGGELSVGVYRPRFTVAGVGDVHEVARAMPGLFLGARFDL
jgi:hypothetical protein